MEGPVGRTWYRDGYLFEPLREGRVRVSYVASNKAPQPFVLNTGSWLEVRKAMRWPVKVWSNRGRNRR